MKKSACQQLENHEGPRRQSWRSSRPSRHARRGPSQQQQHEQDDQAPDRRPCTPGFAFGGFQAIAGGGSDVARMTAVRSLLRNHAF